MPYRKVLIAPGETYHVYNRGIARAPIFKYSNDYVRFLDLLDYYRFAPNLSFSHYNRLEKETKRSYWENIKNNNSCIVDIFAFCLMANHFHLLLKEAKEKGIKSFLSNVQNGYAKYFNMRHQRTGSLFQAMFKAVRIETEEQLVHVSRYIHLNPVTAYIVDIKDLLQYQWFSFPQYLKKAPESFTAPKIVLDLIGGSEQYKEFVFDQADYQRKLDRIKHLCFE